MSTERAVAPESVSRPETIEMPLLNRAAELFPIANLSEYVLVSCHHVLKSNVPVLQNLLERGLSPEHTFILGKPYSTDATALEEYRKMGIQIDSASAQFDSTQAFDEYFPRCAEHFLNETLKRIPPNKKILVWDDGGTLLKLLAATSLGKRIRAVEHTSSGYYNMMYTGLSFPIINMARSKAKLVLESPFIVEDTIRKFENYLQRHPEKTPKKILVIGGGALGSNFKENLLKRGYDVTIFDTSVDKSDHGHLESIIGTFDVIIGTTGKEILSANKINLLKHNAIVFSASSSDREFDALGWRKLSNVGVAEHDDIQVAGRVLLNNGFPLNFNGAADTIPPRAIQLTRALTLASLFLAADDSFSKKNGWLDIPFEIQKKLTDEFARLQNE